ncbi:DUF6622 family protein [Janthinobacterium agaricidamnosum]|uniref:Putative membrane protein n=1 Tax=Janthinobacterium agaricidamnosum NBRC 102515 = DSM 9628 TaxID=1349767 RepID=W0V304_9BURK|nr:DUF6622 family protein [Janthinobacterium agaricidamnosum]CDG81950.1 putative membrane protein [Janthinobacterium agaricidamnosum NBRC 102515 = DSM 9628]
MIRQIIQHTPLYVWAILALLVYRGLAASKQRQISVKKLHIMPVVMLLLSLQGVHGSFGLDGLAPLAWMAGAAAGATLAWRLIDPANISADPRQGVITQPGSWVPLMLMMAIFCMKYIVAVMLAINPAHQHQLVFVIPVCALYGLCSGIFLGSLLRSLAVYHRL